MMVRRLALAVAFAALTGGADAGEVHVAVAANFTVAAEAIATAFTAATGDDVVLSFGATGGLYTQIVQGAPFEVFLAADAERPALAVTEGLGVEESVVTYAIGRLALYSASVNVSDGLNLLRRGTFAHLAIADPQTAPYGAAAMQVLAANRLTEALTPKLVVGQNIGQTLQFVDTGNAELGFVALSQVISQPPETVWVVPESEHAPIHQDAVLLTAGADNPVAVAFLAFLKGEAASAIIESFGYGTAAGAGS